MQKILLGKPKDKKIKVHISTLLDFRGRNLQTVMTKICRKLNKRMGKKGLLTIHEGNEVDVSKVADWFLIYYKVTI